MREMLSRGKRIDNGEWVEGYYVRLNDVSLIITEHYVEYFDRISGKTSNSGQYVVAPSTISEFTGLTDKNGKKIFEGDVVKLNTGSFETYAKITYSNGTFWIEKIKHDLINLPALHFISEKIDYCVVGNIYDNPELLKG